MFLNALRLEFSNLNYCFSTLLTAVFSALTHIDQMLLQISLCNKKTNPCRSTSWLEDCDLHWLDEDSGDKFVA
jgi:hypothetical protein